MNTLPWACLSCDATFPHDQKNEFEAHLKDMGHVTEGPGPGAQGWCSFCGDITTTEEMQLHLTGCPYNK